MRIIKQGDCRTDNQKLNVQSCMTHKLTDTGVLEVEGNDMLLGEVVREVEEYECYSPEGNYMEEVPTYKFESQFRNLDFHTINVCEGVNGFGEGCLNGCKSVDVVIPVGLFMKLVDCDNEVEDMAYEDYERDSSEDRLPF